MRIKKAEISISILSIIIAIWFLIESNTFPDSLNKADVGPAAFPKMISILVIIFSILIIVNAALKKTNVLEKINIKRWKNIVASIGTIIAFVITIPYIGFYLSTAVFFPILLFLSSETNWKIILIVTLVYEVFSFVVFENLLRVPLP